MKKFAADAILLLVITLVIGLILVSANEQIPNFPDQKETVTATPLLPTPQTTPPRTLSTPIPLPILEINFPYQWGQVTAEGLNLREGPSTDFAIVGGFQEDDWLVILAENKDQTWLQVQSADGTKKGWVAKRYVELSERSVTIVVTVVPETVGEKPPMAISTPPSPTPSETPTLTREEILLRAKKAITSIQVLRINAEGKRERFAGSAVIVSREPFLVVTAFHLVGNTKTGQFYTLEKIALPELNFEGPYLTGLAFPQEEIDLAAFIFPQPEMEFEVLALQTKPPAKGEEVLALGYPNFTQGSFEIGRGTVIAANLNQILTFTVTGPGSSGGALMNEKGELVGITIGTNQEGNTLATRASLVQILINKLLDLYEEN